MERIVDTVLDVYFQKGGNKTTCHTLVKHQIDSYNDFLDVKLHKIVSAYNPIKIVNGYNEDIKDYNQKIFIYIEEPHYTKPIYKKPDGTSILCTPNISRLDNLSYTCDLYVNARVVTEVYNKNDKIIETRDKKVNDIYLGKLPIMVGSKACVLSILPEEGINSECMYDYGGYFIINGNEKVLISQDRIKENYFLVFKSPNGNDIIHGEIRSMNDALYLPAKTISLWMNTKAYHMGRVIRINCSFLRAEIPVFIMFRALGIITDEEIIHHIVHDLEDDVMKKMVLELRACCEDAEGIYTKEDAIAVIMRNLTGNVKNTKTVSMLEYMLIHDFIPHVSTLKRKALFIGHMIQKMLNIYLNYETYDNRDSYINKRIDTPGVSMSNLFRQCYSKITKELKQQIEKDICMWRSSSSNLSDMIGDKTSLNKYFKQSLLDSWLKYALSTGNWGIKSIGSFQNIKQGVSQVLSRMSYNSTLSHLRRINTAMEKSGKLVHPRKLDNSQYGMICPAECFDPNTPILMWDGNIHRAEDIVVGDYLIDDKGNPVRVKSTCSGEKAMYEVIPQKKNFMRHTVTDNHILTLKIKQHKYVRRDEDRISFMWFDREELNFRYQTFDDMKECDKFALTVDDDDVLDITIEKYLLLPNTVKKLLYLFKSEGINWEKKDVVIDPYMLGMLLGDMNIPMEYLINDRNTRLAILAGLIDTNGSVRSNGYEIRIGKLNNNIVYDIEFLVKSLGFSCNVNDGDKLLIKGRYLHEIPVVIIENRLDECTDKKCDSELLSLFELVKKDVHPYVGWQLDGNGRFLSGDMTILHNTPEGNPVGLVKNMAMSTGISVYMCCMFIKKLLVLNNVMVYDDNVCDSIDYLKKMGDNNSCVVYLNGEMIGYHSDPPHLYSTFKHYKRSGYIYPLTSVVWDIFRRKINISTEGGRMYRPMFIVDNNDTLRVEKFVNKYGVDELSEWCFDAYLMPSIAGKEEDEGFIEYLDIDEFVHAMVAMSPNDLKKGMKGSSLNPNYTNCEIHASLMYGVVAADIAFSNHNQAPRNCYQSAMSKQALGMYISTFNKRMDTIANVLNYCQNHLVKTKLSKYINSSKLPSGCNAMVAIMTYSGFNQEDGIMINQSAIDRGLFVSTNYKTIKEQCNKNHSTGEEEVFMKPDSSYIKKPYNYSKLDKDGFVPVNTFIEGGDVIVGKVMPKKLKSNMTGSAKLENIDCSITLKPNEKGMVDMNYVDVNNEGYMFCKMRYRNCKKPVVGDKLASHIAQKSSIGMVYRQKDMPFTKDGIVPDLIMNPHAIPSRMTMSQLMCCVLGKAAAFDGYIKDGTPYENITVNDICKQLEKHGMNKYGNEVLYDGRTGMQIKTDIFIGPTYYQRLKHMVSEKMHSRGSNGPIVLLTRQPSEGRCLTMDHDILTEKGWLSYDELCEGTKVAVLQESGIVKYEVPSGYYHYENYRSDMYSIRNKFIDTEVTSNHRMYVKSMYGTGSKFRFMEVKDIVGDVSFKVSGMVNYDDVSMTDDMILLMALWYCAHRMLTFNGGVVLYRKSNELLSKIEEKNECEYYDKYMIVYNSMLYNACKSTSDCNLPEWVFKLNSRRSKLFVKGLMGDMDEYYSIHEGILDDIARVCVHANLCCVKGKNRVNVYDYDEVDVLYDDMCVKRDMIVDVFCLTVSSGIFMVRRNGKAYWTGNSRCGGLRLGEMERDGIVAHGASMFLKERLLECSDNSRQVICKSCGTIAISNQDDNMYLCRKCKNNTDVTQVRIPYSFKLLIQELECMNIGVRMCI
jgi:DNA-directed RNA polymerase beta subunit